MSSGILCTAGPLCMPVCLLTQLMSHPASVRATLMICIMHMSSMSDDSRSLCVCVCGIKSSSEWPHYVLYTIDRMMGMSLSPYMKFFKCKEKVIGIHLFIYAIQRHSHWPVRYTQTPGASKVLLVKSMHTVAIWQHSQTVIFSHTTPDSYLLDWGETYGRFCEQLPNLNSTLGVNSRPNEETYHT